MHKYLIALLGLILSLGADAQTVKSPNGNVSVTFSLTGNGVPTYEMSYKGRAVVKPSHLGLELAKDKHATKGMEETSLMDGFTETGRYGDSMARFATTITSWPSTSHSLPPSGR